MPDRPELVMEPATGDRLSRFVGDRVKWVLRTVDGRPLPSSWQGRLRTTLGRGAVLREEIIRAAVEGRPLTGSCWRDVSMQRSGGGAWELELALTEVGYYRAKAFALDERGWQVWPTGPDAGISVHPDGARTANTIYCAFTRMFGSGRTRESTADPGLAAQERALDQLGYTVIPASGTFRDLARVVPHIVDTLGCRILHLLPVNPTPTTRARFGRYGSPYAGLDLTAIDPALVDFDRGTNSEDQFHELESAVHRRGARLFLDLVVNHTGWGSWLMENRPEWFLRGADGQFRSPGAWGVTWEDLVELNMEDTGLWEHLAQAFLTWCRRGVDGFRCDAGYKVPKAVWQFITARVHREFPDTVFLLEGLGGGWGETEALLTEGGMQWAYSELFQEYSGRQVAGYLDHAIRQSRRLGTLIHYSETHDNDRLARRGRVWSLMRNRLCALTSVNGGFGFTCGVEWLATERVRVHGNTGMRWGKEDNLVVELGELNRLLAEHPCFFDGATLNRLSPSESPVLALARVSADGEATVLVLVNTEPDQANTLSTAAWGTAWAAVQGWVDLLKGETLRWGRGADGGLSVTLAPGASHCLAERGWMGSTAGSEYRRQRALAAWAVQALSRRFEPEEIGPFKHPQLAVLVERAPEAFLGAIARVDAMAARRDLVAALKDALRLDGYVNVVPWTRADVNRVTLVPVGHWLLVEDESPFRATLAGPGDVAEIHAGSVVAGGRHMVAFPPRPGAGELHLRVQRSSADIPEVRARLLQTSEAGFGEGRGERRPEDRVLLTNGRGGMARLGVDPGSITSKYDCVLGANLHPTLPVDRHILVKRVRAWANADGFIWPLNGDNLEFIEAGPPAVWRFSVSAGDGRFVGVEMRAEMVMGRNTTRLEFRRLPAEGRGGREIELRLTVRLDLEDRNFHWETKRNGGAEHHFTSHLRLAAGRPGFVFGPAPDRQLHAFSDRGAFHQQPEWSENIPHPVEVSRGQEGAGDAWSPGWFDIALAVGESATVVMTAEEPEKALEADEGLEGATVPSANGDAFAEKLRRAVRAFVVRRGEGRTVVAGYPWFLDWGRDTLICARGLLAAGMVEEVRQILLTFARFEDRGTLPNTIHGDDASNRETTDAPLWFGMVCEELAARAGRREGDLYAMQVDRGGRSVADVLRSIAVHYRDGTPNGIRMDPASGLIWSPAHFTWMDTNHPAGTPREGYPVEIQALWIRLLRQLERLPAAGGDFDWAALAVRAEASLGRLFWREENGWFDDCLRAGPGEAAAAAERDDALRSNCLLVIGLGLSSGERARRCVAAAARHLVVPGALRSLAPLPVRLPLVIRGAGGELINDPARPYWGRYEGDEDTRRKPAYHNGTAWTWTFPHFCEALAAAWERAPEALEAARAYLRSSERLLGEGCLGQLPEIVDGDAPHRSRGCDAQAWGITETLRVWEALAAR